MDFKFCRSKVKLIWSHFSLLPNPLQNSSYSESLGGKQGVYPSCLSQESRCQPHPLRLINAQIYQVYFLKCSHLLFNSHQYTTGLLSSLLPGLPKSNSPHPTPIFIFNLSSILPLGWSFQYAHLICPKCIAGFQWQQSPWSINNARKRPCPTIQIYF